MIQMLMALAAFWAAQVAAARRGRRTPLWGFAAAGLGYGGQLGWAALAPPAGWPGLWALVVLPPVLAAAAVAALLRLLPPVARREAEKRTWIPYRALGWGLYGLAAVYVAATLVALVTAPYDPLAPPRVPPALFVAFALLFGAGTASHRLGAQAAAARRNDTAGDPRPPVVLLRSFGSDRAVAPRIRLFGRIPWALTEPPLPLDGHLAPRLEERLGPVVALGDPEDYLPAPGARRLYPGDAAWRETVGALLDRAGAVVLVAGASAGLAWEIGEVRARVAPGRVLLVTPPAAFGRGAAWSEVVRVAAGAGLALPGADPGPGAILAVDAAWQAHPIATSLAPAEMARAVAARLLP